MTPVQVVTTPPAIPGKYDIIPIHGSDVASYKRCRRYWDWTSPARNNLRRRVDINGVNIAPWFGTGIHYALEMYYDPILSRDPVESFKTWYTLQWEGGIVGEEWLERTYDIHPQLVPDSYDPTASKDQWRIRGLKDILPNLQEVEDDFAMHYDLGVGMMEFYKDYAHRHDDFVVVAAESVYSIPLGFEAIDGREESPNYGKKIEVHARGKRDAIIYYPEQDKFGIIDHKTAARVDDTYLARTEKDEQCSNYLWATIREAAQFDLPWKGKMVDRVVYNVLRKNYPKPPTILKSGVPSVDRQKEGTTAELFQDAVVGNPLREHWFRSEPKAKAYYTYLLEEGERMFVQRELVTRNKYEVEATGVHLRMIAEEMLADPNIYPNPTNEFRCLQCAFRVPCIAADDGSDWQGILADGYEQNRDR